MTRKRIIPALLAAALCLSAVSRADDARDDILIADFEGPDYGDWKTTGEAFGPGPAEGTLERQMPVSGFLGRGLVNSYFHGDGTTGTLTSPPVRVERRYIQFLLGGGNHPERTCINLLAEGKIVRTATYDGPGGSEHLEPRAWDVGDLAGREVVIEIVDLDTGGWGHVNVDQIIQTDRPPPGWKIDPARELAIDRRYLHLPIKNGAAKRRMRISVDGAVARAFDIELADAQPDWWAFLDVSAWRGKALTLSVDRLREDSEGLERIAQSDELPGADAMYREPVRPQFHFTARRGWLNDPNGLVYDDGKYHLFFQHNPYGWNWGNMHWGHAVSSDLVHWRQLPIAIYPDELGTIFSGSAVVDKANTAGFQTGERPPIVCIYTAAGKKFSQCLAYSNDGGRTWGKYEHNPVLPHIVGANRDPKVFRHEPTGAWIMALYLDKNDFAIFSSPDLKHWQKLDDVNVPGTIECPELFEIGVAGEPGQSRWIFYGANGGYLVGRFDGRRFARESGPHVLHRGNCFYASQTYNNIPPDDGRRILIPWGQVALPGMPFNQMMGLPVELSLHRTDEGLRLFAVGVRELETLRAKSHEFSGQSLAPGDNPLAGLSAELVELETEFSVPADGRIVLNLRGVEATYDGRRRELSCLGKRAPLAPIDGKVRLHVFVDRAGIDVFGNDGALYMPLGTILRSDNRSFAITAAGAAATVHQLRVHELQSAWTDASPD